MLNLHKLPGLPQCTCKGTAMRHANTLFKAKGFQHTVNCLDCEAHTPDYGTSGEADDCWVRMMTPDPSAARIAELEGEVARLREALERLADENADFYEAIPAKDWNRTGEHLSRCEFARAALTPTATPPSEAGDE